VPVGEMIDVENVACSGINPSLGLNPGFKHQFFLMLERGSNLNLSVDRVFFKFIMQQ